MTKQFLITVETPGEVAADRLELIREEIAQHAAACVEFYGSRKPTDVRCIVLLDLVAVELASEYNR